MAKGLKDGEPNGRDVYADIIDHPHWQSPTHPHMSLYDRAAQFSAFDALAGYTDMVREEQRLTDEQIELDDAGLEKLNQKLNMIMNAIAAGDSPRVTITYFVPDDRKAGGSYAEITDNVKKVDTVRRLIILLSKDGYGQTNKTVEFDKIIRITGDLIDFIDDNP